MLKAVYPVIGNEKSFPFYLTGIGICEPEFHVIRENGLVSHQFLYTKKGRGTLIVDGVSYIQSSGSLFYMPPGIVHEYFAENGDWTTHWLVFRGENLPALMKTMGFFGWAAVDSVDLKLIELIFHEIFSAANSPLTGGERCSLLIYEYILAARRLLFSSHAENDEGTGIISEAISYINENYNKDITLGQLAEKSCVSLQYFCRIFKSRMGMRPMEYIARRRIMQAKVLLSDSKASISEIARLSGYEDLTYFGMVFRKYEGISPSEYRKNKNLKSI